MEVDEARRIVALSRFQSKIDKTGDCWMWTGTLCKGYGQVRGEGGRNGKVYRAHRVMLIAALGHDDFETTDHLCRNRACVRPEHLEAVSSRTNISRGARRNDFDGMCWKGLHEWIPECIYVSPDGRKTCRLCRDETMRQYRETKHQLEMEN